MYKIYVFKRRAGAGVPLVIEIKAMDIVEAVGLLAEAEGIDNYSTYPITDASEAAGLEIQTDRYPCYLLPTGDLVYDMDEVEAFYFGRGVGDFDLKKITTPNYGGNEWNP